MQEDSDQERDTQVTIQLSGIKGINDKFPEFLFPEKPVFTVLWNKPLAIFFRLDGDKHQAIIICEEEYNELKEKESRSYFGNINFLIDAVGGTLSMDLNSNAPLDECAYVMCTISYAAQGGE